MVDLIWVQRYLKKRITFRVQNSINEEQKKEIQILQRRLGNVRQEFQDQLAGTHSIQNKQHCKKR